MSVHDNPADLSFKGNTVPAALWLESAFFPAVSGRIYVLQSVALVVHPSKLMRRLLRWLLVPLWLVVMIALAVGGLYLGYRRPDVALAVVFLFFLGAWLFWSSWHETVKR